MSTNLSVAFKNALLDSLIQGTAGTIGFCTAASHGMVFYAGSMPATPETAPSGTVLTGNVFIPAGSFTAASNGAVELVAPITVTVTGTGTAGWARLTCNGSVICDVDVGVATSNKGAILSSTTFSGSGTVTLDNFSVGIPSSLGTVKLNTVLVNDLIEACTTSNNTLTGVTAFDSFVVYSGSAPANASLAATGTELATYSITGSMDFNAASGGTAGLAASLTVNASATGTAGYGRFVHGMSGYVLQVAVDGTDVTLSSTSLTSGNPVSVTNATFAV